MFSNSSPLNWHSTLKRLKRAGDMGSTGRHLGFIGGGHSKLEVSMSVITKNRPSAVLSLALAKTEEKTIKRSHSFLTAHDRKLILSSGASGGSGGAAPTAAPAAAAAAVAPAAAPSAPPAPAAPPTAPRPAHGAGTWRASSPKPGQSPTPAHGYDAPFTPPETLLAPTPEEDSGAGTGLLKSASRQILREATEEEQEAASKITRIAKGRVARKDAARAREAAAKIVAAGRGYVGRKAARAARQELEAEQSKADEIAVTGEERAQRINALMKKQEHQKKQKELADRSFTGLHLRKNLAALLHSVTGETSTQKKLTPDEVKTIHIKMAKQLKQPLNMESFTKDGRPGVRYNKAYYEALKKHHEAIVASKAKVVSALKANRHSPGFGVPPPPKPTPPTPVTLKFDEPLEAPKAEAKEAPKAELVSAKDPSKFTPLEGHSGFYLNAKGRVVNEKGRFVPDPRKSKAE